MYKKTFWVKVNDLKAVAFSNGVGQPRILVMLVSLLVVKYHRTELFIRSTIGMATGYGRTSVRLQFGSLQGQECSILHIIQTGSRAHQAYYPIGTGGEEEGFPQGVNRLEHEADHSHPNLVPRS
jgi:hypothetical protein